MGESQGAPAHRCGRCQGYAPLVVLVDGTVKMIHHPFVTDDGRFVGKLVVVGFRRVNQGFARPVCPVDQVVGAAEGVEGVVDDPGSESRKVKHHPKVAHTLHHGITGDAAFVVEDGIARVACPAFPRRSGPFLCRCSRSQSASPPSF